MNNYCIGLLIIVLVYICFQNNDIREGLDVPARHIDKELLDYLKRNNLNWMEDSSNKSLTYLFCF